MTFIAVCGNGVVEPPFETCERGGLGCGTNCLCLPGFVRNTPFVSFNCIPTSFCGNGNVEPVCGNGIVEQGEQCEVGGFGCSDQCVNCRCSNGFTANNPPTRDCNPMSICGDHVIEPGEQCEIGGDGCLSTCQCSAGWAPTDPPTKNCKVIQVCGDGIIEGAEQCELGGFGCAWPCVCAPFAEPQSPPAINCAPKPLLCGNCVVDPGEQCEQGGFGCTPSCTCAAGTSPTVPPTLNCRPDVPDLCPGGVGLSCVAGISDYYLQCTPPFFTGLRRCAPGTTCQATTLITDFRQNPCF
eukprot:m51a1_g2611 putative protein kinase domain containing protein (296) ;mRNA; f:501326-503303